MKCIYACHHAGPAIEVIPDVWIILGFTIIAAFGIYLCFSVPVIKTERQLRNERLKRQPSTRPGWSLEENRARVLAHLEREAREEWNRTLEIAAAQFNVDPDLLLEHEQELVA